MTFAVIYRKNVEFAKRIILDRVGDVYGYGGNFDPLNKATPDDCSGTDTDILDACVNGTLMAWSRLGLSTESYRYRPLGPGTVGPFELVHIASPNDYPPDAVVKIALHHEGNGGPNSHMWCELDGLRVETNGSAGTVIGNDALAVNDPYANDWWYLPGPIVEDGTPRVEIPVTVRGLDYAGGRPSGAAIKAAGYSFVCRYLTDGGPGLPGKLLLPAEAADLRANGVAIVSNWETTTDRALAGHDAGVADAQAALAQVLACGGHDYRPIYFSVDFDATPEQQTAINDYLFGAGTILPGRVGVYGGYWVVKRALDSGAATWGWQTEAWSGGNIDPRINILQRSSDGFATVGGVQCDIDESRTDDFGQWDRQPPAPPPPAPPPGGISMADAQSISNDINGLQGNGTQAPWRIVHLLRDAQIGDLPTQTDGDAEAPNVTASLYDQVVTLAKVLTRRYKGHDVFDMLALIGDKLGAL